MADREHTSKHYEQQLRLLKDRLLVMCHNAEQMIADAIQALMTRRPSLANEVIGREDAVDNLELEIDNLCYEILALEQPVARDLRFVATALKIVRDLERIGDTAVNIAERTAELLTEPEFMPPADLPIMAEATQRILKKSLDAFVNADAEVAEMVIRDDAEVDRIYDRIFRNLLAEMTREPESVSRAIKLIFIAKHLERVGDHSANIAEMVIFLVRGQDVRHPSSSGSDRR
jgi:phosphate transport system protein